MVDPTIFQLVYQGDPPPWDIDRPQRVFVDVAERISGTLLDAGCGTGENALFFASRGLEVTGFDFLSLPIEQASRKAASRGLHATFLVKDALTLSEWNERFDVVLDSGLFHVFSDEDRARYVEGLATVLKPGGRLFLLCFSDAQPGLEGPRRVSKWELERAFAHGWAIESIENATFEVRPELRERFGMGDPKAWFAVVRRTR
jgi:cyclopropane fatty-acyl-phospholipid synthase-like methyltransferase